MSVAISPGEVAPLEANAPAREKLMLLLIFLLGGILRLIGANNEFWYDEIVTIQLYVRKPLHQALTTYIANNHVLNSILAHLAASLHPTQPEQPWLIRLPAILFGIFTVPAFYYLVRQLWPGRIALLGTLLLAVSYPHVYYTQQARGYSAFIFFAVMACGLLLRMESAGASRGASWRGAAYALCIALGAYAQLLMVFVIAGQGMAFLLRQRWRALAWLAAGCALAGVLYLPMLAAVREYYATHKHDTGVPFFSRAFVGELKPVLPMLILGLIFGPLVLWRMWKRNALAALVLLVPLALNIIIPAARGEGVHPRSLIYALPIAYLFVMEAIDWTGRRLRWAPVAITLLLAALNLVVLAMYYPLPKQGFQAALRYVDQHRAADEGRIGVSLAGKAERFYDPTVDYAKSLPELKKQLDAGGKPAWVIFTFSQIMGREDPELRRWIGQNTKRMADFPGAIGDGTVFVQYWQPAQPNVGE